MLKVTEFKFSQAAPVFLLQVTTVNVLLPPNKENVPFLAVLTIVFVVAFLAAVKEVILGTA